MSTLDKTEAPVGPPWMTGAKSAGRAPDVKREVNAFSGLAHIALFVWALATAGPLIWVLLSSFKNNTEIFLGKPFALPDGYTDFTSEELEGYLLATNERQATIVPNARFWVASESGHDIHQDQPELVIAAIQQVLKEVIGFRPYRFPSRN